ncbi:MAG TPA: phage holin family protein [Sedimentisphaerales bacterium]|nr:phage holin family protein [Sedimentisphaerales bacterium]
MEQQQSGPIDSMIAGGMVLALIGVMVLLTPLVVNIDRNGLVLDFIAGGLLLIVGSGSLIMGLKRHGRVKPPVQDSPNDDVSNQPKTTL